MFYVVVLIVLDDGPDARRRGYLEGAVAGARMRGTFRRNVAVLNGGTQCPSLHTAH
jgi:hypothetical protein